MYNLSTLIKTIKKINMLKIAFILFMLATIYLGTDMSNLSYTPTPEGEVIYIPPYYVNSSHVFSIHNIYIDVDGKIRQR